MNFELDDEQHMLVDGVRRYLGDTYDFEARRGRLAPAGEYDRALWNGLAEMGLLGLPFAEEQGGFGRGWQDVMLAMEVFGEALVVSPYVPTVVFGGAILSATSGARLIPQIVAGETLVAVAHEERQSRGDPADVAAVATRSGDNWRIDGAKVAVLCGDVADWLIVSARVAGEGIGLFLVDSAASGVQTESYVIQDGSTAADIDFDSAEARLLAGPEIGLSLLQDAAAIAITALCSDAVGAMAAAHAMTVEYLKTRQQFGVAIGSFQALQHRAADMFFALESARSLTLRAILAVDGNTPDRHRIAAAAKALTGRAGKLIGQQSVQLHGAIGVTDEHAIGHYLKRLGTIDTLFGNADRQVKWLAGQPSLLATAIG